MEIKQKRELTPEYEVDLTLTSVEIKELIAMIEYDSYVMRRPLPSTKDDIRSWTDEIYLALKAL